VDQQFEGAAFSRCTFSSPALVELAIAPEDSPPINPSPWYAFRVSPLEFGELTIRLSFQHGRSRYWPKVSTDGEIWTRIEPERLELLDKGRVLEFTVSIHEPVVWVSAQELYTTADYSRWMQGLAALPYVEMGVVGVSAAGRPIHSLSTQGGNELVLLLGRQHPPEVTGAFAMESFVESLLAESSLALQFRERYTILSIPLMNPDGVASGHWRHNAKGADLNRDWGIFVQPETASVAARLATLKSAGMQPVIVLDFHSTRETLFYTQLPEESPWSMDFAGVWLDRVRQQQPEASFTHAPRSGSGQANAKNYFFEHYSIPSMTYELGDDVSREEVEEITPVFADEFMRLLLER
jgi:hypothetical protein